MRRLIALAGAIALLTLAPAGCRTKRKPALQVADDSAEVSSVLNVADSRATSQLLRGFYGLEAGAWRWTTKNFAVALHPPAGSQNSGATLQMSFSIPETVSSRLVPLTIAARIGTVDLGSETFSRSGDFTFRRDVAPSALKNEVVTAEFSLDKSVPPSGPDSRELGIIVTTIGLVPK